MDLVDEIGTIDKTIEDEIDALDSPIDTTITARDILYRNMLFYDSKAAKLAQIIIKIIKAQDKSRADLLVQMNKEMTKYNTLAIDCATRLAPYTHARLQSVETKSTVEHRYVMRTPTPIRDKEEWLKICAQDNIEIEGKSEEITKEIEVIPEPPKLANINPLAGFVRGSTKPPKPVKPPKLTPKEKIKYKDNW